MPKTIQAACAVIQREDGAILMVKRLNPPEAGLWSVPGGKVEPGESLRAAAAREAFEETGLRVEVGRKLWTAQLALDDEFVYELHDFAATPIGGALQAGDDAAEVRWVPASQISSLPLVAELLDHLCAAGLATRR
ncbi:NUDIX domain-containing protein [Halomonas sp. MCCC 1A11036]|uniref:NUDIX domain-containing protein n=1 Tax=Billgrantia zhangzhouensis TaxID=2733481 RepID=A0ABS9AHH8_9GAMM|nr:NUDIX domain-containing protein [Halomonas zhangzhouensis]MCE8021098.1 NUDIX domain-containing protein [Halomonas zhangzhouensis]